jgi:hypothetical protein
MGEYISINSSQVKIGVCESLDYARLDQLISLFNSLSDPQEIAAIREYLNPNNGFRYRFPFPHEDNIAIGQFDRTPGMLIKLSKCLAPTLWESLPHWDHYKICHNANYHGTCNVNVFFNCPLDASPPPSMSQNGPTHSVVLTQQRIYAGQVVSVIDCPYCGRKVRLDYDEALELAALVRTTRSFQDPSFWETIAQRILAGYIEPVKECSNE